MVVVGLLVDIVVLDPGCWRVRSGGPRFVVVIRL